MPAAGGLGVSVSLTGRPWRSAPLKEARVSPRLEAAPTPVPRARETLIRPPGRLRQQDWAHQSPDATPQGRREPPHGGGSGGIPSCIALARHGASVDLLVVSC